MTFDQFAIEAAVWQDVRRRLEACQLDQLQHYSAWVRMRGFEWQQLGPLPITSRDRAAIYAGLSGQRHPAASSRGMDHLLPPGLGPEAHITEACAQPSPFTPSPWPEPDIGFVVDSLVIWQEFLPQLAAKMRKILTTVATALTPLEICLHRFRSTSALKVAAGKRPAFIAAMSSLLRWPDRQQAINLTAGLQHSG